MRDRNLIYYSAYIAVVRECSRSANEIVSSGTRILRDSDVLYLPTACVVIRGAVGCRERVKVMASGFGR